MHLFERVRHDPDAARQTEQPLCRRRWQAQLAVHDGSHAVHVQSEAAALRLSERRFQGKGGACEGSVDLTCRGRTVDEPKHRTPSWISILVQLVTEPGDPLT